MLWGNPEGNSEVWYLIKHIQQKNKSKTKEIFPKAEKGSLNVFFSHLLTTWPSFLTPQERTQSDWWQQWQDRGAWVTAQMQRSWKDLSSSEARVLHMRLKDPQTEAGRAATLQRLNRAPFCRHRPARQSSDLWEAFTELLLRKRAALWVLAQLKPPVCAHLFHWLLPPHLPLSFLHTRYLSRMVPSHPSCLKGLIILI